MLSVFGVMVIYYESSVVSPPFKLFMGIDKYENDELIKYGWPEDVWFHVNNLSSAHVYLRLRQGETLTDIPQSVLDDVAQLVKANSIQGSKMDSVEIVYTFWSNLKKTANLDVGQVQFHNEHDVRKIKSTKRNTAILNRLKKTKIEIPKPDLKREREQRDCEVREMQKKSFKCEQKRKAQEVRENREKEQLKSYAAIMKVEKMTLNTNDDGGNDSDEFM